LFFYELDKAKRMIKKVAVIIVLLMVISLSVAGCTIKTSSPSTTPTPTRSADLSSDFEKFIAAWDRIEDLLEVE
jgi:uncharacterized protein YybS (DUF2232 family)